MSVNIELPSRQSLRLLAPDKPARNILAPMGFIDGQISVKTARSCPLPPCARFAPAGQSTQMIIGASPRRIFKS
jgi:predicted DNA-binding helix-hairpin-helix protein